MTLPFKTFPIPTTLFDTTPIERSIFGAEPDQTHFALTESNDGFVSGQWLNAVQALQIQDDEHADSYLND